MRIAYLDEFGQIGPYIGRGEQKYNESPVFGLAGIVLPCDEVRGFATWFFQRKRELLNFEIARSGQHPAVWEKKGSSLYTLANVERYRELRAFTNRFLNRIERCGGNIVFVGLHKQAGPEDHKPLRTYTAVLRETIKRLNAYCQDDRGGENLLMVLDQHQERETLLTEASRTMFGRQGPNQQEPMRRLMEPPFQVESHRYQTVQAADWICGLVGRLSSHWVLPEEFPDWAPINQYFGARVRSVSVHSGIRSDRRLQTTSLIRTPELERAR